METETARDLNGMSDEQAELAQKALMIARQAAETQVRTDRLWAATNTIRDGQRLTLAMANALREALRLCQEKTSDPQVVRNLEELETQIGSQSFPISPALALGARPMPRSSLSKTSTYERTNGASISSTRGAVGLSRYEREERVDVKSDFTIEPEVAQRFNAYATAAYPNEIGGMLRIVPGEDGGWKAIDLMIFEQEVNGAYFELDGEAVAKFNMELVKTGRIEEIAEWRSLIHSHPSMTPFLSGPDRENIERLAGTGFAFSVICSAQAEPSRNYYAVHYAQGGPVKMIVHNLPVRSGGGKLSGVDLISEEERARITAEVAQLCTDKGWNPGRSWQRDEDDAGDNGAAFGLDLDEPTAERCYDSGKIDDETYQACDALIALAEDSERVDSQAEMIESVRFTLDRASWLDSEEANWLADLIWDFQNELEGEEYKLLIELHDTLRGKIAEADSNPNDGPAFRLSQEELDAGTKEGPAGLATRVIGTIVSERSAASLEPSDEDAENEVFNLSDEERETLSDVIARTAAHNMNGEWPLLDAELITAIAEDELTREQLDRLAELADLAYAEDLEEAQRIAAEEAEPYAALARSLRME